MKKEIKIAALLLLVLTSFYSKAQNYNWVKQIQGAGDKVGTSMALDNQGNIYVTGKFAGTINFGATVLTSTTSNHWDIFIAKADANLNWQWAKSAGGIFDDIGSDIVVNKTTNESYIVGWFKSASCNFSGTIITNNIQGFFNGFVAGYSASGNLSWVQNIQSASGSDETCNSIGIDNAGKLYITGYFSNPTASICGITITSYGLVDGYVASLEPVHGNANWAVPFGTANGWDQSIGIAVNPSNGNSYVTGYFTGPASFGNGISLTGVGPVNVLDADVFVASYNSSGTCLWAQQGGGTSNEVGYNIDIDNGGNVYITGYFQGTSVYGASSLVSVGNDDVLIAKCNSGGWQWAKKGGSTNSDNGTSISVESTGFSYVTGRYSGNATFGTTSLTNNGGSDMFVAKYDVNGNNVWAVGAGSTMNDDGTSLALDGACRLYIMGDFINTVTFGTLAPITSPTANRPSTYIGSMVRHAANAGPDKGASPCCGATIGTPAQPGATYSWSPATGIIGPTNTATVFAQPAVTTTYTLTMILNGCNSTDQVTVFVSPGPCCRLEDENLVIETTISPNPTKDGIVNIINSMNENPYQSVEVYDMVGSKVFEKTMGPDETQLNLSRLNNGVYVIRFHNQNGDSYNRIIKQ